jgi:hypothetical protein
MAEMDWDTQGKQAMAGLEPLRFLLGRWSGVGVCHGESVRGELEVAGILDGSWIQASERLVNDAGAEVHADVTFYRFDVEGESLQVLQLFEHGHMLKQPVEVSDDGFRWVTGPGGPQVNFLRHEDSISYSVILTGEAAPAVEMTYKRP